MEALLAFGAALLALRLAGSLAASWRQRHAPELAAWAAGLGAYALASAALAWGAAHGWDGRSFRVYYLFGGLLTAPLLGVGSLLLIGRRAAAGAGLLYAGLSFGVALAAPLRTPVSGTRIPAAQEHFDLFPARLLAIAGNGAGTLAVVSVALLTFRRRQLANALVLAGIGLAATGSALAGLGTAATSAFVAAAAPVLYVGLAPPAKLRRRDLPRCGRGSLSPAEPPLSRQRTPG